MADLDRGLDVIPVFSRTCDGQPRMTFGAPRRYTVYFVIDDVRTALRPDNLGHKQTSHFSASFSWPFGPCYCLPVFSPPVRSMPSSVVL